ncbi:helix-turn-helix transcriptional regulator [Yinghuangia soli]|uniref:Helix-turn-helix transcriptional regulator n=1 Tax=Yinghuangia soli TaxID=2908204 RepID=A0AA41U1A7_9ACTN|nr:helix-turn-helix transcriptional regulator [Yinghuangia soli]MCF2525944.1 helix-turn-helix transcriptional regulator [Yinghuangia soli]
MTIGMEREVAGPAAGSRPVIGAGIGPGTGRGAGIGTGTELEAGARRTRPSRARTAERRRMLGEFIRSRRERTTPEAVGLPPGPRRRTPGLRREEVAMLGGIGITWYTWLEQGRSVNVSAQVLLSVVRVLGMDDVERAHVFTLAELSDPEHLVLPPLVAPGIQVMLDQLDPLPAVVVGPRWEILAGNRAYRGMIGDYTQLPEPARNLMWLYFVDPEWQYLSEDWADTARKMVAKLRSATAADAGDPDREALLQRLRAASPVFRELWEHQDVQGMNGHLKTVRHREAGDLDVEVLHLLAGDQRGTRVTVYTPRDEETRARMARLLEIAPRSLAHLAHLAEPVRTVA